MTPWDSEAIKRSCRRCGRTINSIRRCDTLRGRALSKKLCRLLCRNGHGSHWVAPSFRVYLWRCRLGTEATDKCLQVCINEDSLRITMPAWEIDDNWKNEASPLQGLSRVQCNWGPLWLVTWPNCANLFAHEWSLFYPSCLSCRHETIPSKNPKVCLVAFPSLLSAGNQRIAKQCCSMETLLLVAS